MSDELVVDDQSRLDRGNLIPSAGFILDGFPHGRGRLGVGRLAGERPRASMQWS